jgi:penicillin-insensitive murein endopeptidase
MDGGYRERRSGGGWVLLAALITGSAISAGLLYLVAQHRSAAGDPDSDPPAVIAAADVGQDSPADDAAEPSPPVSVGAPARGQLRDGVRLDELGQGYEILSVHQGRDLSWGTGELVDLVRFIGKAVHHRHHRTVLVGNMSAREGGPIRHSASHQSGRDVDLAFCYLKEDGRDATPPDYVPLDAKGRAAHLGLQLDPAATWTIIEAATVFTETPVQHIFVSRAIEKRVLNHARRARVDPEIRKRAAALMAQPRGAEPHNDHLHIRISCPASSGDECSDKLPFKGGGRFSEEPTE